MRCWPVHDSIEQTQIERVRLCSTQVLLCSSQRSYSRTGAPFMKRFQVQKEAKYSTAVIVNMMP